MSMYTRDHANHRLNFYKTLLDFLCFLKQKVLTQILRQPRNSCVRARQCNTEGVNAPVSWKSIYSGVL